MMNNFSFSNSVKIIFGKGSIAKIAEEIPADARVLMTYGGGSIKKNGVYEQVKKAMEGRVLFEFGGIEPNPHFETCMKAVELCKKEKIDFLLSVGGGSVLDGTKLIAAAQFVEGDPWGILVEGKQPTNALPIGVVLTLPATGSEMNSGAVITKDATKEKRDFNSRLVLPKFSVLDPETTYSLPPRQIGNGVVDTFVHVAEQYLTYPVGAKVQDRFAESILSVLVEEGPQALKTPEDYEVRSNLMWASTWALNGWISKGVPEDWATHMIGHEITALYGLDHGQTLAIVLPGVLSVMRGEKGAKIMQMGERVFGVSEGDEASRIEQSIAKLEAFFVSMGVKTRLSDYGLAEDCIEPVVKRLADRGVVLGENKTITPEKIREILKSRV